MARHPYNKCKSAYKCANLFRVWNFLCILEANIAKIQEVIMKFLGNLLWLIFGGLECALGYFAGSLALMVTIIGIPLGIQTLKLGILCLWPFGSTVSESQGSIGCISVPMNIIWWIFGGLATCVGHLLFGLLLCVTIVGVPFGMQHFKMAKFALWPFGREISTVL